ncbi:hypothetical protein [Sphingobium sp. D43FB]|nr:hypothetical protein [Sphingobium sp. D43FB]
MKAALMILVPSAPRDKDGIIEASRPVFIFARGEVRDRASPYS